MNFNLSAAGVLKLFQAGSKLATLAEACEREPDDIEDALRTAINDLVRKAQHEQPAKPTRVLSDRGAA